MEEKTLFEKFKDGCEFLGGKIKKPYGMYACVLEKTQNEIMFSAYSDKTAFIRFESSSNAPKKQFRAQMVVEKIRLESKSHSVEFISPDLGKFLIVYKDGDSLLF